MAISIDFLSNVSGFLRGTQNAERALDDVADALDDLVGDARSSAAKTGQELDRGVSSGAAGAERAVAGVDSKLDALGKTDAGHDAGDDLSTGVRSGGADAERSVDSLEGKFRELAAASRTESTKVGSDISKSVKSGSHEASEGVKTLKENTGSNLKEVAASFDGTWSGAAGGAQGLIAEIAEGFGPVGLIAGAVAAGGLGLIISGVEGAEQKTEAYKAQVAELADQLIETGRKGGRALGDVAEQLKAMATSSPDDVIITLQEAFNKAKEAGADYAEVVTAIASNSPAQIGKAQTALDKLRDSQQSNIKYAANYANDPNASLTPKIKAVVSLEEALKRAKQQSIDASRAQELAAKAGLTDLALKQKAVDQVGGSYQDAAGEVEDYTGKESGLFDVKRYIKAMKERADALRDYQETLSKSSLTPEAKSFIEDQGADQAAALIAGYKRATPAQREELNKIWTASGRKSAQSYSDALGDDLRGTTVRGPSVKLGSIEYKDAVQDALRRAQIYADNNPIRAKVSGFADDFRRAVV